MAEDDDVNYSEIKFAQSGDGVKQERQKDGEVIYSNVVRTETDKEECVYSTVRPRQGAGSESGVSAPQGQPKPKDPSPITRSRSISVSSVPITRSKVKAGLGTCRRSPWLLLVFLLLSLLGLTIYLGVMYVLKGNALHEVERNLTGSLVQLKSLQNDKDNLTTHLGEQEKRHNNESVQLQNELRDVRTNLSEKSNAYNDLLGEKDKLELEKEQLQRDLQDVQEEAWRKFSDGWKYLNGSYYYFSTDEMNWNDSRDACVTMGGHLVIIETREEQDFLKRKSDKTDYWIGLTDSANEDEWRWMDNNLLNDNKKFWSGSEPDNWKGEGSNYHSEGEDCARFDGSLWGKNTWFDAFCTIPKNYICESIAAIKH